MPLEKRYLSVVSLSRDKVFGSFVIGVPETKVLELKQKYPDCETRGRDPRVDKSIKRDITEGEKRQIREYLHIPSLTAITFEFGGGERPIDEGTEKPLFEGENGKKFSVFKGLS